jgi:hypothetical protein
MELLFAVQVAPASVRVDSIIAASLALPVVGAGMVNASRPHPSVALFGSTTVAVTDGPMGQSGPVDVLSASTVRSPMPVIDTGTDPPGVTATVAGLAGSSVKQSPYQTLYDEVNGYRLAKVLVDPGAITVL